MKKFILLFVFVSAGLLANAQGGSAKLDADTKAKNQLAKMTEGLSLTADQQTKAAPIILEKVKAMETNRSTNASNPNVLADGRKKIMDKFNSDMKAVLTPDQMSKLAQYETDQKKGQRAVKK